MINTETIKSGSITALAESLGIEIRSGKAKCLWHEEKTPSLSFDDSLGIYKCFGCGETGDHISLYQKVKGVSFKDACEALGSADIVAPMARKENATDSELYESFIEYLYSKGRGEVVDSFLKDRGFTEETLSRFMIAGIRDVEDVRRYLLETFGKERLMKAGMISAGGFVFRNHPIIIPVVSGGRIVSVRARNLTGDQPKYMQVIGIPVPLFNSDEDGEEIYLTEGEFDSISLSQCGAVSYGISGTNGFKDSFVEKFKDKDVVLVFDNDAAGEKARKDVSEKLKDVANSISYIVPSLAKDVNEMLQHGIDILSLPKTTIKSGLRIMHIADIAEEQRKDQSMVKTPTGFNLLDKVFEGGLRPGNSVIVAAVGGEGKTAFMQTVSYHYSRQGIPSLWLSYEESMAEIWERFENMGVNRDSQLFAPYDNEDNKINFIEKVIEKQKKKTPFFVCFIDQLSNLAPKVDEKSNIDHISSNFALYLGRMSTQIKEIAMKHKIVIFTAHQLGRSGELAYSDMVRHAPDKVLYIEREEAPSGSTDKFTDRTFLKVNKNRPYGTRPIIDMKVIDGRFDYYTPESNAEYMKRKNPGLYE